VKGRREGNNKNVWDFSENPSSKIAPELLKILDRFKEEIEASPKSLPEWMDGKGATPNEIVRSALFTARNRNRRRAYLKQSEIVVTGGGSVLYLGEELRQDDELVWMRLLQLAKGRQLGEPVLFTPYSFLKAVGWRVNNWGYQHLRACLLRMKATAVQITSNRLHRTVVTSLIDYIAMWDPDKHTPLAQWEVRISKVMSLLFEDGAFTLIDLEQRKALPKGIATKLHSYWSSHKEPYPVRVETLQRLCGSQNELRFFRRELKKALDALVDVGFLETWGIEIDLVAVIRRK
jgi:hypothetical protein